MAARSTPWRDAVSRHAAGLALAWDDAPGPRALVCEHRSAALAALFAASFRHEALVLPASTAPEAVAAAVREAGRAWHDGGLPAGLPGDDVRAVPHAPPTDRPIDPQATWVRLSTSGSTGAARSVPKTVDQLRREARTLILAFGIGRTDHIVATVPPWHIYGLLFSMLVPFIGNATVDDDTPFFPDAIAERLARATVLVTAPAHLRALADLPPGRLPPLSRVFSSGAPLPTDTAERLLARHGWRVTEVLGSTETGGIAWRIAVDDPRWRPLPGVRVAVDDDGRLLVDSPWLPADAPRPWPTDDLARLEPDGRFEHLGRADDVVKVAGKRVSVGGLSRALLSAPGVADAAVLVTGDAGESTLHAGFVPTGDTTPESVRAALAEAYEPTLIPRLYALPALPREATGKLPRGRLAEALAAAAFAGRQGGRPPERTTRVPISPDHPGFAGHFPGHPVLPGAILLGAIAEPALRTLWGPDERVAGVELVTFHRPVLPGDALDVLGRRDGDRVTVEVQRNMTVVLAARWTVGPA